MQLWSFSKDLNLNFQTVNCLILHLEFGKSIFNKKVFKIPITFVFKKKIVLHLKSSKELVCTVEVENYWKKISIVFIISNFNFTVYYWEFFDNYYITTKHFVFWNFSFVFILFVYFAFSTRVQLQDVSVKVYKILQVSSFVDFKGVYLYKK